MEIIRIRVTGRIGTTNVFEGVTDEGEEVEVVASGVTETEVDNALVDSDGPVYVYVEELL